MRKIESDMLAAIAAFRQDPQPGLRGRQFDNTRVDAVDGSIRVFLHCNLIAASDDNGATWQVSLAGWNTNTTRSRLSALIRTLHRPGWPAGAGVGTKAGEPRLHDARGVIPIDATGWHKVHA